MMTETERDTPRVWVGCLGCYNAGALVGAWVDGTEAGELEPHRYLAAGEPPSCCALKSDERWCFDHEGFGGLLEGECSPAEAQRIAEAIAAMAEDGTEPAAVAAWLDHTGERLQEWDAPTREGFEEAYQGEYRSEEDFAEELAEELGLIPEDAGWPAYCIDWERAARELFMGDYWSTEAPGGMVYVFRSV